MKKYKIGYTEGLNSLITYILTSEKEVSWSDLVQFSVDYQCYVDLYMNLNVVEKVLNEKNKQYQKNIIDRHSGY